MNRKNDLLGDRLTLTHERRLPFQAAHCRDPPTNAANTRYQSSSLVIIGDDSLCLWPGLWPTHLRQGASVELNLFNEAVTLRDKLPESLVEV